MPHALRSRLTFVNLVAAACLFVVLGGDSFAAEAASSAVRSITGKDVKNGSLTGADIKSSSLTGKQIRNGSLTAADLAPSVAAVMAGPTGATGVTGAKGDVGPAGAQGAKGDAGAPGAPAMTGLQIVSLTSSFDSSGYKQLAVNCPAGKAAISGGSSYSADSGPAPLAVATSQPATNGFASSAGQTPNGWFVAMNEEGAFAGLWNVTGFAVCATLAS
jgi:hypothetical protein